MPILPKKISDKIWNDTTLGMLPWAILFSAFLLLAHNFSYVRTSVDRTVADFDTRTMYLMRNGSSACVGDTVFFKSRRKKRNYYLKVAAGPGSTFSLKEDGYILNGNFYKMDNAWINSANKVFADIEEFSISGDQVLMINSEFKVGNERNDWPFEIIGLDQIKRVVTHVLLSVDFRSIGQELKSYKQPCF